MAEDLKLYEISRSKVRSGTCEDPAQKSTRLAVKLSSLGLSVTVETTMTNPRVSASGLYFDFIEADEDANTLAVIRVVNGERTLVPVSSAADIKALQL